jgi:hypothetical protein
MNLPNIPNAVTHIQQIIKVDLSRRASSKHGSFNLLIPGVKIFQILKKHSLLPFFKNQTRLTFPPPENQ